MEESQILPWVHSIVRNCQSRTEMSFMTVKPAIAAAACCSSARRTCAPTTTTSSTSQSRASVSAGLAMSSAAPVRVSAYFGNRVGYAGSSRPISVMWLV
ncbi:Uncharacterised protein [Mycobacteroides abscessus subsp. abscessus]|nr:Uncharacterised protein [Mycobacteroides abscessus subsp. abscessus]